MKEVNITEKLKVEKVNDSLSVFVPHYVARLYLLGSRCYLKYYPRYLL